MAFVLIGFMGAGKTSAARELASVLEGTPRDSDELLAFFMGKNTPERQDFIIANLKVEKDLVET